MCLIASNYDLRWAAGFIEADGTITKQHSSSVMIGADQKTKEPLNKLRNIFGGMVYSYTKQSTKYYRWYLYGDKAVVIMKTLYNLFSERRKKRIDECILRNQKKKPRSHHNIVKTHCKHGHPYSGDNLIIKKNGGRDCRECHRIASKKHYYKKHNLKKGN